jgi:hypothetical protein
MIPFLSFWACKTAPGEVEIPVSEEKPPAEPVPVSVEEVFDPGSISQETFDTAKTDVQRLIQDLNGIIRAKNYKAWVSHLGEAYIETRSAQDFLDRTSAVLMESNIASRRKKLSSLEDYFLFVVVPSHQNDRVDDIEFESPVRVKAYTITDKGRLRLYDLEHVDMEWKIVN